MTRRSHEYRADTTYSAQYARSMRHTPPPAPIPTPATPYRLMPETEQESRRGALQENDQEYRRILWHWMPPDLTEHQCDNTIEAIIEGLHREGPVIPIDYAVEVRRGGNSIVAEVSAFMFGVCAHIALWLKRRGREITIRRQLRD